jgi:hypothetical protein
MPVVQSSGVPYFCQGADFKGAQCQGVYTLKEVCPQELSSRIGEDTEFETLQLEGKIMMV